MNSNSDRKIVWLCDLTHSFQTNAMNKMPLAIGMIASYCIKMLDGNISFQILKFLTELLDEIKNTDNVPFVVGFSNYVWNNNLNLEASKRIKKLYPQATIVFGGPNFPVDDTEQIQFLKKAPWIDFYLPFEGEKSFSSLIKLLLDVGEDLNKIKKMCPPQTIYLDGDNLIKGDILPPLEASELSSPYLDGFFDKYFKTLVPLIQTTRGCPFSCTYCCSGAKNESKIKHRDLGQLNNELEYIAKRCSNAFELYIADSNFGMYSHDIEFCKDIAKIQSDYSWPKIISVTTGKKNKERIYQAAKLTSGAISIAVSVQSTEPEVLKNVKRVNMPLDVLLSLAKSTKELSPDSRLYSDIILGLPGDTLGAHLKSIKDVIDKGSVDSIVPFQLMILPGTLLATKGSRDKYQMVTRYRVLPRCFGRYIWDDGKSKNSINTAEIEEICVSNSTMSFDDYLECRKFDLSIAIFYNEFIFSDLYRILNSLGLSLFDFIQSFHKDAQLKMVNIYDEFVRETKEELWSSREEILEFIKRPNTMEKYREGEYGSNLLYKYKTLSYMMHMKTIIELICHYAEQIIEQNPIAREECPCLAGFLKDMEKLFKLLGDDFMNTNKSFDAHFNYNVIEFITKSLPLNEIRNLRENARIEHTQNQKEFIENYKGLHGENLISVSKLIAQLPLKKLIRKPVKVASMV